MDRLKESTPAGPYRVQRHIKEGVINDSYIVTDGQGKLFFLKRFDQAAVPEALKADGTVAEIAVSRQINHPNVTSYAGDGVLQIDGVEYPYLVTPFYRGTLLSERLGGGRVYTPEEARRLIIPILEGLVYLHSLGYNHNDLCPRNILLEDAGGDCVIPRIIDLGHAWKPVTNGTPPFPVRDLNLLYTAPEALKGIFAKECDSFSVAVILYAMVCGKLPWSCELSMENDYNTRKFRVQSARRAEITMPEELRMKDPDLLAVISAGLMKRDSRCTVEKMLAVLKGQIKPEEISSKSTEPVRPGQQPRDTPDSDKDARSVTVEVKRNVSGGGFADVAGMDSLKKMLTERVIWVLSDKEKATKYRLTPPNGMILYGPPGCGKTFFAQKFAEESHFNYMLVNGSDLGSIYVHGTQGKIASLFKEAQAKAPTVICFDEFDAFVPTRGSRGAESKSEEINEFLSQLNNCAQRGIFVIGTTNRIDIIDPAVLRKGRFDLHCEIPAPDPETRRLMFLHHLKDRPLSEDIDAERLAALTDGYAASDIAFIVNEAAMVAALADELIAQRHLEDAVRCNPSSLGRQQERRKIGY